MSYNKTKLIFVFISLFLGSLTWADGIYWQEFLSVKADPAYAMVFDKEASPMVQAAVKNVENIEKIGDANLAIRPVIGTFGCLIVDEKTMPSLYGYVNRLCIAHNIAMPIVAIIPEKGFLNAFAEKYFSSSGTIVMTRDLLKECTQEEV